METMVDDTFLTDVDAGLSGVLKSIPSRYFYDDAGSLIFQDIMKMPEYYPTACEFEILMMHSNAIIERLDPGQVLRVVEFGAGDGTKTRQLLTKLEAAGQEVVYVPIDISSKAIEELTSVMHKYLPTLKIQPMVGNYLEMEAELRKEGEQSLFLFLGSNIGNYPDADAAQLLKSFYGLMKTGDKLLIGFDLQKNPATIRVAYDDPAGITRAFNLNLLDRINRELDGNFRRDKFEFYSHYDPVTGEVRSYLVSLINQQVFIGKLGKAFTFQANELIWTELSKKYTIAQIGQMAGSAGFKVLQNFMDCKHYFTDSLWEK